MMNKIFITGATGNIGQAVINYLLNTTNRHLVAGVRNIERAQKQFTQTDQLQFESFDMETFDPDSSIFAGIDLVFLLRPPHLADVNKYFKPLIQAMVKCGVNKVVFLSVQGVEKSSVIPHHKIEKLIVASGMEYIFVRPSYFMQNLSTTFLTEIQKNQSVTVPAGKGIFNWVDVDNIGEATAQLINQFEAFKNKGYDITGNENKTFQQACNELSRCTGMNIRFISPSLLSFYRMKKKENLTTGYIAVMILLHYLARFQKPPEISQHVKNLTGKEPKQLADFFEREKSLFLK